MSVWSLRKARAVAPACCIWLLAGSILMFQPGGLFRFVWVKVVVLLLVLGVGSLVEKHAEIVPSIRWMTSIGAVAVAISMGLADSPMASFMGRWPRYEGALLLAVYAGVFVLGAKVLGSSRGEAHRWRTLEKSVIPVALVLFLISALEAAGLRPLGGGEDLRPGALLGNATDQGLIGIMIASLLAIPALLGRDRLATVGLIAAVGATILSGSRGAILGLLAALLVIAGSLAITRAVKPARLVFAVPAAVLVLVAGVLMVPAARDRLFSHSTVTGRWLLWQDTIKLLFDRPWTGAGPSGFVDAISSYHTTDWAIQTGSAFPPDSPHTWLLQAATAGGVPLMAVVLCVAVLILRHSWTRIRDAETTVERHYLIGGVAAVVAYGTGLLTAFTSPGTTPLALFVCGGLVATPFALRDGRKFRGSAPLGRMFGSGGTPWGAAAVIGLVVAVPAGIAEWPMAAGASAASHGDMSAAQRNFRQAYALRPWDADTALLAAQAFAGPAANGDPTAGRYAVDWARLSLATTPDSTESGLALAIGEINTGNLQGGKDVLDGLIVRSTADPQLHIQRAIANFGLGKPGESIADLNTAAFLDPKSAEPWIILGPGTSPCRLPLRSMSSRVPLRPNSTAKRGAFRTSACCFLRCFP